MFTPEFLMKIVHPVLDRTKAGKALWRFENGAYVLPLTNEVKIALRRGEADANEVYSLKLLSAEDDVLGKLDLRDQDPAFAVIEQLYQGAEQAFSTAVLDKVLKVVDSGEVLGQPANGAFPEPPPDPHTVLPPEPSPAQKETFFDTIKGLWKVDTELALEPERVLIEGESYRVFPKSGGEAVQTYLLSLLACTPDLSRVELGKRTLDGRLFQIEVLNVGQRLMEGVVKHNLNRIRYTR
jgi:hypothetical protein